MECHGWATSTPASYLRDLQSQSQPRLAIPPKMPRQYVKSGHGQWSLPSLTNYMELSLFWDATSCSSIQELPSILWNLKVHYWIHNSPPLASIPSPTNPAHTTTSCLSKIHPNIFLVFLVVSFPLAFPPITYTCSSSPSIVLMTRPSHPPRLDYSNYTWQRVQITKLLVMQFSSLSRHLIPLWSQY
jgi:hypothetical protein